MTTAMNSTKITLIESNWKTAGGNEDMPSKKYKMFCKDMPFNCF
jgi:hypothetical protein